ncbi:DMT family transporter [Leucobacter sp. wl10]|uniref:DMT family transporter n=1 Tax=Leucobacter sp. wl10 TaxID=2304677 RepID=UPI0013C322B2|nr:DMT family transporter [Leucobacter sp. wl10]
MFVTAIALAALGAVGLAVGTHLQHRAVREGAAGRPRDVRNGTARALLRPVWLLGLGLIAVATALNVAALGLAPIALVQPVGSLALVCAVIISALALRVPVRRGLVLGISLTVVSVAVFVGVSAGFASGARATDSAVSLLTWLLLGLSALALLVARARSGHIARVACAGIVFGAVASAVHVVAVEALARFGPSLTGAGPLDTGTVAGTDAVSASRLWGLIALLAVASALGMWLVQTAYASGPPETVLAGLTVIDPLAAVAIGAIVLGEYARIPQPGILALTLSGLSAFAGIALVVRCHPSLASARRPGPDQEPVSHVETLDADGASTPNRRS